MKTIFIITKEVAKNKKRLKLKSKCCGKPKRKRCKQCPKNA